MVLSQLLFQQISENFERKLPQGFLNDNPAFV